MKKAPTPDDDPRTDGGESWPKTVRVSGREYEVTPEMSITEFTEVAQSLQNEAEKIKELSEALGIDVEDEL